MTALLASVAAGAAVSGLTISLLRISRLARGEYLHRLSRMTGRPLPPGWGRQLATLLCSALAGPIRARRRAARRHAAEKELEDVLMEVAECLHAGESLLQAIQRTARSVRGIWRELLEEILSRYDQGLPLAEAFHALDELGSTHVDLWTHSIDIHHRTGGDLSEVLVKLAETVRDQRLFAGEMRAKTAESRWTAYFVAATPFMLMLYFALAAPSLVRPLLHEPAGRVGICYAAGSWGLGLLTLKRLIRFGN